MMSGVDFYNQERNREDGIPATVIRSVMGSIEIYSDQRTIQTGQPKAIIDVAIGISLLECTLLMMCPQFGVTKERGEKLKVDILILIRDALDEVKDETT